MAANLADELLADLDELGGGEDEEDDDMETNDRGEAQASDDENAVSMDVDGAEDTDGLDLEAIARANDIHAIAKLLYSKQVQETVKKVEEFMAAPLNKNFSGPVEEHPEYRLVVSSNKLNVDIDNEIVVIHKFIRDHYAPKFPELESLVLNPLDYARVVKQIGNEMDLTKIDLATLLPSATVMVVTVTASTTAGQPLAQAEFDKVIDACNMAIALDDVKKKLLQYVETRMSFIAPNMTAICGPVVAAKLMGAAGGLTSLSRMPSCNVLVLGATKKVLQGFSTMLMRPHQGFVFSTDIVQGTPPDYRTKAGKLIADKCSLAARVDSFHESVQGEVGHRLRSEIIRKLEKIQEPPPAKQIKPIPIPDEAPRKRRGGKRARKAKERLAMTELRKQANRMEFGVEEDEAMYGDSSKGLGKLSGAQREMSGKVRAVSASTKNKVNLSKKAQQQLKSYTGSSTGSGTISGLSSSLVFTPVQGLELVNPDVVKHQKVKEANDKWFANSSFVKVQPK